MHIGILGSYFNPPHLGHLLVAEESLELAGFDTVWFLPGLKSTFNKQLISVQHRLNMTKLIKLPKTEVSALEIDYKLDGNTINLVPILKEKYPQDRFTFIIGSDQLPTFHKWGRWEELLTQMPFLVFPRAGYPMEPLYQNMTALSHPDLVVTNISSSLIRKRVAHKKSIDHLVLPKIKQYIATHNLYR